MSEQHPDINTPRDPAAEETKPEILRNEIGKVIDPTVVVDEADRTVLLTDNETIVIEKEPHLDLPPVNRPRKVYKGMWGPVEIGVLGAGMLAVLGVILLYIFFVIPSNRELESKRARVGALEAELASAREKWGNITNVQERVGNLISSVNTFESIYLPIPTTGRTALYQRLNGLIAAHGLVNSAGPDYSPLEILDKSKQNEEGEQSGKSKFRSFFPGVYVTMTVEGPYANVRRFIQDIEIGSEFIVVSAVEIEPSDAEEKQGQTNPGAAGVDGVPTGSAPSTGFSSGSNRMQPNQPMVTQPNLPSSARGKTHGSLVSLKMEMAAYFRRPNLETLENGTTPQ